MDSSSFPSIEASFRFHPPSRVFTLAAPTTSLVDPGVDTIPTTSPVTKVADAPFACITALIPKPSEPSYQSSRTLSTHPASTATSAAQPMQQENAVSKGAHVGIIIGITVVVILILFVIALVMVDYRRRLKRQHEKKQNRGSEPNMWEAELRIGRSGQRRDIERTGVKRSGGLWAGLKIGGEKHRPTEDDADRGILDLQGVTWERMGKRNHSREFGKGESRTEGHTREPDYLPAYMPRDQRSMISEGSGGVLGNRVETMDFPDDRRL